VAVFQLQGEGGNTIAVLSLIATAVTLLFGIFKRLFLFLVLTMGASRKARQSEEILTPEIYM